MEYPSLYLRKTLQEADERLRRKARSGAIGKALRELEDDPYNGERWQETLTMLNRHGLSLIFRTSKPIWGGFDTWRVRKVKLINMKKIYNNDSAENFYRVFFRNHKNSNMNWPLSTLLKNVSIEFSAEKDDPQAGYLDPVVFT